MDYLSLHAYPFHFTLTSYQLISLMLLIQFFSFEFCSFVLNISLLLDLILFRIHLEFKVVLPLILKLDLLWIHFPSLNASLFFLESKFSINCSRWCYLNCLYCTDSFFYLSLLNRKNNPFPFLFIFFWVKDNMWKWSDYVYCFEYKLQFKLNHSLDLYQKLQNNLGFYSNILQELEFYLFQSQCLPFH